MLVKQILSASALALTANALLVPTEMLEKVDSEFKAFDDAFVEEISKNFNGVEVVKTNSKTVHLDCSTCPFALKSERNGKHEWISDTKSDLELIFATEDGKLTLNGVPFYPISNTLPPILTVKQMQKESEASEGHHEAYEGELVMSYGLEIENKRSTEENADVVSIIISIIGLEDQMIRVDDIKIKLIETKDKATIHSITTKPASNGPDAQCTTILCRVLSKLRGSIHSAKTAADGGVKKVKGCCLKCLQFFKTKCMKVMHGKQNQGHHMRPAHLHNKPSLPSLTNLPGVSSHPALPDHHDPNMRHHVRGWFHSFLSGVKRGFAFIVFPIVMGIAFGFIASTIGMMIGKLVVFAWTRFIRKPKAEIVYERIEAEEKDGLPAYEDIEPADVMDDKKGVDNKV
ncbi:hypothetical protein MMC31_001868 [Peltigera leucophlebia]|nr:hypothetical protein [Peltigera leucophlebia]